MSLMTDSLADLMLAAGCWLSLAYISAVLQQRSCSLHADGLGSRFYAAPQQVQRSLSVALQPR